LSILESSCLGKSVERGADTPPCVTIHHL